jgi:hypothetical protein
VTQNVDEFFELHTGTKTGNALKFVQGSTGESKTTTGHPAQCEAVVVVVVMMMLMLVMRIIITNDAVAAADGTIGKWHCLGLVRKVGDAKSTAKSYMGTTTPRAQTMGARMRETLSPTPPDECLSTFGFEMDERSATMPLAIIACVRSAISRLLMPLSCNRKQKYQKTSNVNTQKISTTIAIRRALIW